MAASRRPLGLPASWARPSGTVRPPRDEDALRAFTAATMLQPASGVDLATALEDTGRTAEAIVVLEDLIDRRPDAMALLPAGEMQERSRPLGGGEDGHSARCIELLRQQMETQSRRRRGLLNLLGLAPVLLG